MVEQAGPSQRGLSRPTSTKQKVYNVNLVNWTIDVQTTFDQKIYMDVQVGSPYLHPTAGEGIYAVPEIGSKCLLCIPSDGPPPIVIAFMAPMEQLPDTATPEAPAGTVSSGGADQGTTTRLPQAGQAKARRHHLKGRDGNFMRLDRGEACSPLRLRSPCSAGLHPSRQTSSRTLTRITTTSTEVVLSTGAFRIGALMTPAPRRQTRRSSMPTMSSQTCGLILGASAAQCPSLLEMLVKPRT